MSNPAQKPIQKKRPIWQSWLIGICIWTLIGLFIATQNMTARPLVSKDEVSWLVALVHVAIWAYFWSIITFVVFAIVKHYPLDKSTCIQALSIHIGFALVCHLVLSSIYIIFEFIFDPVAAKQDGTLLVYAKLLLVTSVTNLLTYFCIAAVGQTIDFYKKYRDREFKATLLETELISAQLSQLRSQLHPHFLFNTLSAITTLIYENREAAEKMVIRLSELLRIALEQPDSQTRALKEELAFVHKYLEIETVRFGNRLVYNEKIDDRALDARVPFLILQPLIENALKHAVEHSRESCKVNLHINVHCERLKMTVEDSGPDSNGFTEFRANGRLSGNGIGLTNTRSRLEHLYPQNHQMHVNQLNPGFRVEIEVPFEVESPDE